MKTDNKYSVIIVSDGISPYNSAVNLSKYIKDKSEERGHHCDTKVIFTTDFKEDMAKDNKIIIIGHHALAINYYSKLKPSFDKYGMKFAYDPDKKAAVLYSSRSELGYDGSGKKAFAGYYNKRLKNYKKLAEKYDIPLKFGQRSSTRQSQYDFLWMKFADQEFGSPLFDFLEIKHAKIENMSQGEFANEAFESMKANSGEVLDLETDIDNEIQKNNRSGIQLDFDKDDADDLQNNDLMDNLRSHLNYNIYMTDIWHSEKNVIKVPEENLSEGEVDAILVPVGCYLIKYAKKIYVPDEEGTGYHPADKEQVELAKELLYNIVYTTDRIERTKDTPLEKCRAYHEISAKHITELGKPVSEFHLICRITDNLQGEDVFYLETAAAVKNTRNDDDSTAKLFIEERFIGSSRSLETWYIYSPDTIIRAFSVPDENFSTSEKWDLDDESNIYTIPEPH